MLPAADPYKTILHNVDDLHHCFEKGWTYPFRPIQLNKKYPYKLLFAENPDDFSIQIDDRISATIEANVQAALVRHKNFILEYGFEPICITKLKEMLPVTVKDKEGDYHRGEINCAQSDENRVNVYLVDLGEDQWVVPQCIYPPSIDLLRFPKLSLMCRLAQIVPLNKARAWPEFDYKSLFEGKESSIFSVSLVDRGMYEVYLEVDKMNIGYEMVMNKGLADFVPLGFIEKTAGDAAKKLGKYPRLDYSDWIGQKLSVFGTKVSKVGKRGHIKVHLQLDTNLADSLWEKIDQLPKTSTTDSFSKEEGDAVLVRYGATENDRYRATIMQKSKMGYLVKLVDYGDFVNVQESDLFKIPDELVAIPEAVTPCFMVELFQVDQKDQTEELKAKLTELAFEKNLFCLIGHSHYEDKEDPNESRKCIVSLSTEDDKPFYEILNLPKVDLVHNFTHKFPGISQSLAPLLLNGESSYFPITPYEGVVSCVESENSVWLHLEGDDIRAEELTEELTEFYMNWKDCPQLDNKSLAVGTYVGAQQNSFPDLPVDLRYYRAKITQVDANNNSYRVMFLDYGNDDVIPIEKIKPLPNYFGKEKCFALQVALPVEPLPGTNGDALYDYIFNFTEGMPAKIYLQHQDGLNYAWIFCMDKSLAHSLDKAGLVKLKISPNEGVPFQ